MPTVAVDRGQPGAVRVKICGLRTPADVTSAVNAGARYLGFVFFSNSPRHLDIETARDLALGVPPGVAKVALTVNAGDDELAAITDIVPLDMLQLHGAEAPQRVTEVRARFGLPVMKALGVADIADLAALPDYEAVADQILLDARPPGQAARPGGNGLCFDWRLIAQRQWEKPWMLAGGLDPENVVEAIRLTGARQVDVSSGVENARGIKDARKMVRFIAAVHAA